MKSSIFALTLACSTISNSDAFAIRSTSHPISTSLDATNSNKNNGAALATALGLGIAAATIMTPSAAFASEYVDFSMPTYQAALNSPINASMKGEKMLMATPFGGTVGTDGTQAIKDAPTKKTAVSDTSKEDAADARAEAKKRTQEARAKQMAAAEAALPTN